MIRNTPVTDVHSRKIGIKAETAGIYRRKPRYEASHKTFRVFEDGREKLEYDKLDVYTSLDELLAGEFTHSRQGKLFLATFTADTDRS